MSSALADEGGLSFWLPGQFGSLAATPGTPGLSASVTYLHSSERAGANARFPRGGRIDVGVDGKADLFAFGPTYVFETPVFGAQASVSVLGIAGRSKALADVTLSGPNGGVISRDVRDTRTAFGDLIPSGMLKWSYGVHNLMAYAMGDIPVGAYDKDRLANTGLGHGAIDGGGGYTYFDPLTGHEFSAVSGFTYNFKNKHTDYKNGVDWHVDWGASQFLSKHVHVGAVGFLFNQITGDNGSGAVLGDFKSRVAGVGPQVGFLFPVGAEQGYLNIKGYKEFAARNRTEGWSLWVTFAISPSALKEKAALVTK